MVVQTYNMGVQNCGCQDKNVVMQASRDSDAATAPAAWGKKLLKTC
jgi:hypothetical protein